MQDQRLPVSVKGVVLSGDTDHSAVLLLKNRREEWELPGGRIQPGESPEESLVREVKEETGFAVAITSCIGNAILTIRPPHVPYEKDVWISAYGCRLQVNSPAAAAIALSSEHCDAAWVRLDDVPRLTDLPNTYKTLILKCHRDNAIRPLHPASTLPNPQEVTAQQLYLYDLQGFLVIRGALENNHLNELRRSVRHQFSLAGRESTSLLDISFDEYWGRCWPRLIDNPSVFPLLLHIFDGRPKLDHAFTVRATFGNKAGRLHHQGYGMRSEGLFHSVDDKRISNGLVGIIYSLYDNDDKSGGFCCVPGSHKTNFPTPDEYYSVFNNPVSRYVRVLAGDAILFNEALTHGTTLAVEGGVRHAIMFKYTPGWMHYRMPISLDFPTKTAATLNHAHDAGEGNVQPEVLSAPQREMLTPAYSRRRPVISLETSSTLSPTAA